MGISVIGEISVNVPDIADDIAVVSASAVRTLASPSVHVLVFSAPVVAVAVKSKAVLFPWLSYSSVVNM